MSNYQQLLKVTGSKIDIAFYLMHSMEGSTKGWKKFAQKDRTAAENFARAATENGVKRIIYLSRACHGKDATEPDINLSYNSHEKIEFIETYIR